MCRFDTLLGFLNCCGAIDAAHVIMTLPAVETSDDWYGRERNYSMFLQGTAVHEMRFLDIVKGWPGGLTVPRLLKCSGFFELCQNGECLHGNSSILSQGAETREYIVDGDRLSSSSMAHNSWSSDGISASMSTFNAGLEAARLIAVRSFLQLMGSWRILSEFEWRPDKRKL